MKTIDTDREKTSIPEEPSQVYEKPCIEAEEAFETFVLDCGYTNSGQSTDCGNNPVDG